MATTDAMDAYMEAPPEAQFSQFSASNRTPRVSHFDLEAFNETFDDVLQQEPGDGSGTDFNSSQRPHKLARLDTSSDVTEGFASGQNQRTASGSVQHGHPFGPLFQSWSAGRLDYIESDNCGQSDSSLCGVWEDDICSSGHKTCYELLQGFEDESFEALAVEAKTFSEWMSKDGLDLGQALKKLRDKPQQEELFEDLKKRSDQIRDFIASCEGKCAVRAKDAGLLKRGQQTFDWRAIVPPGKAL